MYKNVLKRFLDFWIALVVLICISPLLVVVTLWLHVANKGAGAFFLQERPGKELNVLKGDMALIGPRPLLVQYLPLYSKEQARRHEVRPGISGWAQCHGRNAISWTEKFKLDVWYVDHVSLKTDLTVVWMTIQKVLRRADISEQGHATMEVFNGHN